LGSFLAIFVLSVVAKLAEAPADDTCHERLRQAAALSSERELLSVRASLSWLRWLRIEPAEVGPDFESFRYLLSRFDPESLLRQDQALREARRSGMSLSRFERLRRQHELFRIPRGILLSLIRAMSLLRSHAFAFNSSFAPIDLDAAIDRYVNSLRRSWGFNIHHLARAGEIYAAAEMIRRGFSLVKIGQLIMEGNRIMAEIDFLLKDPENPSKYILGEVQVNAPGARAWAGNQMKVRQGLLDGSLRGSFTNGGEPMEVSKVFIFVMRPSERFLEEMSMGHSSGFDLTTFDEASPFARGSQAR